MRNGREKKMRCDCYRKMTEMVETGRTLIRQDVLTGRLLVKCRKCHRQYVVDDVNLIDALGLGQAVKVAQ
jgi:hypothetical protein